MQGALASAVAVFVGDQPGQRRFDVIAHALVNGLCACVEQGHVCRRLGVKHARGGFVTDDRQKRVAVCVPVFDRATVVDRVLIGTSAQANDRLDRHAAKAVQLVCVQVTDRNAVAVAGERFVYAQLGQRHQNVVRKRLTVKMRLQKIQQRVSCAQFREKTGVGGVLVVDSVLHAVRVGQV